MAESVLKNPRVGSSILSLATIKYFALHDANMSAWHQFGIATQ
jgi:hypothetical protein